MPTKRQWVGETVLRKEKDLWGKDWYPGRVVNWNEVTNKHNVVFEKTADWEEFDEWVNLDKASPATLRWDGELLEDDEDGDEEDEEEEDKDEEPRVATVRAESKGFTPWKTMGRGRTVGRRAK